MRSQIEKLPKGKFLLGFSGGVDSSALFFLLLHSSIDFDIAIVDYALRDQSKEEVAYAQSLAREYGKLCHHTLSPKFTSNFESQAREFRYEFFHSLILKHHYEGLILAHQLDDRVEWMMMQFCKGAGLNTLLGSEFESEYRGMKILRPLLNTQKKELYDFCQKNQIRFFEDESNTDEKYLRNDFRKYLQPLIAKHAKGMAKSFEYLYIEKEKLYPKKEVKSFLDIDFWQRRNESEDMHQLDLSFKKRGYILSAKQKQEIIRCDFSCEIVDFVIESESSKIFLFPKKQVKMSLEFRDFARKHRIPKRLRGYLFASLKEREKILEFLEKNQIGIYEA